MGKCLDLIGQKFGRLLVIERISNDRHGKAMWSCLCNCGKQKIVASNDLIRNKTKSCGCLSIEKTIQRLTKHGHNTKNKITETYRSWQGMIQRCINPKHKNYGTYGGRDIKVCERWRNSFSNFLTDMGERPKNRTLDRINNELGYYKNNCQWSTTEEQGRNKRNNHLITFNGKTQCISAWAEEVGIVYGMLIDRINKLGWSPEKALTTPVKRKRKAS